MPIHSSDPRYELPIDNYQTGEHLINARRQAEVRGLDDVLVVDCDSHHYESDNLREIIEMIEDKPLRHLALNTYQYKGTASVMYDQPGFQDIGGRVTRYYTRKGEKIPPSGRPREVDQA